MPSKMKRRGAGDTWVDVADLDAIATLTTNVAMLLETTWVGKIEMTGLTTVPNARYAFARGQAVSRTGLTADLWGAYGTRFGAGDGSTTFNLPDYRGRYPAGHNEGGAYLQSGVGQVFGTKDAVVVDHGHSGSGTTGNDNTDHSHSGSGTTGSDDRQHYHQLHGAQESSSGGGFGEGNVADYNTWPHLWWTGPMNTGHLHGFSFTTGGRSAFHQHSFSVTVGNQGVSGTNQNLPPTLTVNFLVRLY